MNYEKFCPFNNRVQGILKLICGQHGDIDSESHDERSEIVARRPTQT